MLRENLTIEEFKDLERLLVSLYGYYRKDLTTTEKNFIIQTLNLTESLHKEAEKCQVQKIEELNE